MELDTEEELELVRVKLKGVEDDIEGLKNEITKTKRGDFGCTPLNILDDLLKEKQRRSYHSL
jgi:hypothetical protein